MTWLFDFPNLVQHRCRSVVYLFTILFCLTILRIMIELWESFCVSILDAARLRFTLHYRFLWSILCRWEYQHLHGVHQWRKFRYRSKTRRSDARAHCIAYSLRCSSRARLYAQDSQHDPSVSQSHYFINYLWPRVDNHRSVMFSRQLMIKH